MATVFMKWLETTPCVACGACVLQCPEKALALA